MLKIEKVGGEMAENDDPHSLVVVEVVEVVVVRAEGERKELGDFLETSM